MAMAMASELKSLGKHREAVKKKLVFRKNLKGGLRILLTRFFLILTFGQEVGGSRPFWILADKTGIDWIFWPCPENGNPSPPYGIWTMSGVSRRCDTGCVLAGDWHPLVGVRWESGGKEEAGASSATSSSSSSSGTHRPPPNCCSTVSWTVARQWEGRCAAAVNTPNKPKTRVSTVISILSGTTGQSGAESNDLVWRLRRLTQSLEVHVGGDVIHAALRWSGIWSPTGQWCSWRTNNNTVEV